MRGTSARGFAVGDHMGFVSQDLGRRHAMPLRGQVCMGLKVIDMGLVAQNFEAGIAELLYVLKLMTN